MKLETRLPAIQREALVSLPVTLTLTLGPEEGDWKAATRPRTGPCAYSTP